MPEVYTSIQSPLFLRDLSTHDLYKEVTIDLGNSLMIILPCTNMFLYLKYDNNKQVKIFEAIVSKDNLSNINIHTECILFLQHYVDYQCYWIYQNILLK